MPPRGSDEHRQSLRSAEDGTDQVYERERREFDDDERKRLEKHLPAAMRTKNT